MKTFIVHTRAVAISVISIALSYIFVEVIRQGGLDNLEIIGWAALTAAGPTLLGYLEWLRRKYGVVEETTKATMESVFRDPRGETTETTKTTVETKRSDEGPVGPGALP